MEWLPGHTLTPDDRFDKRGTHVVCYQSSSPAQAIALVEVFRSNSISSSVISTAIVCLLMMKLIDDTSHYNVIL